MHSISPKFVKDLLAQNELNPQKGLGQHFIVDQKIIRKTVQTANIQPSDVIIEIGPGLGALTRQLAQHAKKVVAVEKDAKMVQILRETLAGLSNVEIIHGDILRQDFSEHTNYKVVANLPYYIATPTIRKFLESPAAKPQGMVFIVQKEVAQRICAKPPRMNILAVSVQFYALPKIISYVKKTAFWPIPKVDSAILQITPLGTPPVNPTTFFRIVKAGFKQPRKQLVNNLSTVLKIDKKKVEEWLLKNDIQPKQRAETLTIQNWIKLTDTCLHVGLDDSHK